MTGIQNGHAQLYEASGEVLPPSPHAMAPRVICESAVDALTPHVEAAMSWSEPTAESPDAASEYACCFVFQPVGARAWRVVSVYAEPGKPAIVRIFGRAQDDLAIELITPQQRSRLLDSGFRVTACRQYLRKDVSPELRPTGRQIAFLLLYMLSDVLGYDGREPAYFSVHRKRPPSSCTTFETLGHAELGDLLRTHGLEAGPVIHDDHVGWLVKDQIPFLAVLEDAQAEQPEQYRGFGLFAFVRLEPELLMPVERELRETLRFGIAQAQARGTLLLRHHVRVEGGVSGNHLDRVLHQWRQSLHWTGNVIQRHRNRLGLRSPPT